MSEEPDGILEELSALQTSLAEREQEIKVLKQQRQCLVSGRGLSDALSLLIIN